MTLQKSKMEMFHLKCGHKLKFLVLLLLFTLSLIAMGIGEIVEPNREIKTLVQEFDLKMKTEFTLNFSSP